MFKYLSLTFYLIILTTHLSAEAHGKVRVDKLRYSGKACPLGSVSMSLSPDGAALSVLFSAFSIEVGGDKRNRADSATCAINIDVQIPAGARVSISQFDYRGFHQLTEGARSELSVRYAFMNNGNGHIQRHRFAGPLMENFFVTDTVTRHNRQKTACEAREATFQIFPTLDLRSNAKNDWSFATLDSIDSISRGLTYHIELEPCT